MQPVDKSPGNNCYILIDVKLYNSISYKPPEHDRRHSRNASTTAYAGSTEGRKIFLSSDLLGRLELQNVPVIVWHHGGGGNAKSVMSDIRHNTYSGTHAFVSPTVFDNEEHRKQGINFGFKRGWTVQESSNNLLRPDLIKTTVGGQQFPVRPNYGKDTVMGCLANAAGNWECNTAPKIKVPDNSNVKLLKALTRRSRVVLYASMFDPDHTAVDISKKIFPDDPDLVS